MISLIVFIHINGGNRGIHYGATLGNQVEAVKKIVSASPSPDNLYVNVGNYKKFRHTLYTLIQLYSNEEKRVLEGISDKKSLLLDYRDQHPDSLTGWINVERVNNVIVK